MEWKEKCKKMEKMLKNENIFFKCQKFYYFYSNFNFKKVFADGK